MTRNLWICGLGMMLAGILGLYGHALAAPAGVVDVGDHDAASLFGAQVKCTQYQSYMGCGLDAKPKMGMVPGTKCPKRTIFKKDKKGKDYYKEVKIELTCYECCYACGFFDFVNTPCAPTGSGSGRVASAR
jgi:hypothetical protein